MSHTATLEFKKHLETLGGTNPPVRKSDKVKNPLVMSLLTWDKEGNLKVI